MSFLVALLLLGQIIGLPLSSQISLINCNDKEAEDWAGKAVHYINENKLQGYKQTLNEIQNIYILPRDGIFFPVYLKLFLLETECHVLDSTPVENCTLRAQNNQAPNMQCEIKMIFNTETSMDKIAVECIFTLNSVGRNCTNCLILLPPNDPRVVDTAEYVLNKHNEQLSGHVYEVLEILRGQQKFEPERFYVEFVIVETNCTAQEAQDDHHHCHPNTAGKAHIAFCKATVLRSHASLGKPKDEQFESDCVILNVKEGHARSHLIEQHIAKYHSSPGDNSTVLNPAGSHNHTRASHESHSDECVVECPVAFFGKEVPVDIPDKYKLPVKGCPGRVHHFQV